jgi:acyl carrier protein
VAANAFLDALAYHRRARGLPALTVNWGVLGELGYVAEHPELGRRFAQVFGVKPISAAEMLRTLSELLANRAVQVGALKVDWQLTTRGLGAHVSPRFRDLSGTRTEEGVPGSQTGAGAVLAAAPADRQRVLETFLRDGLAKVLGTAATTLEIDRPLPGLGLDSLMALEMVSRIRVELGVEVPPVRFLDGMTLSGLAAFVAEKLETASGNAAPQEQSSSADEKARGVAAADGD